jgi:hypothetical protein
MVPKKIVRLHNIDIVNLGRLQNFTRAFRTGDIRTRPNFAPFMEGARDPNLRPNPDNQRDADIKQPVRSKTETVWIKHTQLNLMYQSQLSLYWLEQIRRSNACFVHLGRDIAPG